jgi:selenocysteine-specific elongation factor
VLAAGWQTRHDFALAAGLGPEAADELADRLVCGAQARQLDGWIVDQAALVELLRRARDRLDAHHRAQPESPGLALASLASWLRIDAPRLRAALASDAAFTVDRDLVRLASHHPAVATDPKARALLDAFAARPFDPPSPVSLGVPAAVVRALARDGHVVDVDGVWFSAPALEQARRIVAAAVQERGSLTVAEIRDLLGSTRKYVVPIANWLDAQGVTRRQGDERVPGPRVNR